MRNERIGIVLDLIKCGSAQLGRIDPKFALEIVRVGVQGMSEVLSRVRNGLVC